MKSTNVVLVALASVAIGATLGILFAPEKGATTRKKISDKTKDLSSELEDKFNELIESVSKKVENLKEESVKIED
jgi:gas vesicle protein